MDGMDRQAGLGLGRVVAFEMGRVRGGYGLGGGEESQIWCFFPLNQTKFIRGPFSRIRIFHPC